jgi:hypothetical protein
VSIASIVRVELGHEIQSAGSIIPEPMGRRRLASPKEMERDVISMRLTWRCKNSGGGI